MPPPAPPKLKNYRCEDCDSTFVKKYNLDRHIERIHNCSKDIPTAPNSIPTASNSIPTASNSIPTAPNSIPTAPNSIPTAPNSIAKSLIKNQCDICEKIFSRNSILVKHKEKCKGKNNPLQCIYCNEVFTFSHNKYRHQKTCKERILSTDLTIPEEHRNTIIGTNTNNNIQTQNNIENLTQNNINTSNIQNNNNTIIINNFGNESYTHITDEFKEKCIRSLTNIGVIKLIENVHFNKDVPENHNIKIHSLKSQQLSVYNNNEWNIRDKNNVLDDMIMTATASLCRHYHGSPELKEIDIKEFHYEIFTNLQSIYGRVKERYYPIRREVFASLINLCSKIPENS